MKTRKLSTIIAALLISGLMISEVSGANLTASSANPLITFDDTDVAGNEWEIWGLNTFLGVYDDVNNHYTMLLYNSATDVEVLRRNTDGSVGLSDSAIKIFDSVNKPNSLRVDTSGDINLANGSVFIDRSAKSVGISAMPSSGYDLTVGGGGDIKLDDGINEWALLNSSGYFRIHDQTSFTTPFRIDDGAPTDSLRISNTGNVGLGTNNPQEKLDVLAKEDGARLVLTTIGDGTYDAPQFTSRRAGSNGSGVAENTKNLDVMGTFAWRGHDGTDWTGAKAFLWVRADGDWSGTSTGTTIEIRQTPKNSTTALVAMQIKNHADVYFPNGNLYVKGTKMNVPDYVFKEDYKLMPLHELKTFISKNNHLPGVTSAEEVDKAGVVNLSGLQMTLLEKVEELTLYTLQQEEALKTKAKEITVMEKRLAKVETLLINLALDTSSIKSEKVSVNLK